MTAAMGEPLVVCTSVDRMRVGRDEEDAVVFVVDATVVITSSGGGLGRGCTSTRALSDTVSSSTYEGLGVVRVAETLNRSCGVSRSRLSFVRPDENESTRRSLSLTATSTRPRLAEVDCHAVVSTRRPRKSTTTMAAVAPTARDDDDQYDMPVRRCEPV